MRKDKTQSFIEKALKIESHKDEKGNHKFSYDKTVVKDSVSRVIITCLKHGDIEVFTQSHLQGSKCLKCFREDQEQKRKNGVIEFLEKVYALPIHKDENGEHKYTYEKMVYQGSKPRIIITCKRHGDFEQTPLDHLKEGCPSCGKESRGLKRRLGAQKFIERVSRMKEHQNPDGSLKYDYSKVQYITQDDEVEIVCPIHGSFFQPPSRHMIGNGCHKCGIEKSGLSRKKSNGNFIEKIKEFHGDVYDTSLVNYNGKYEDITLICPKHGEFIINAQYIKKGCQKCVSEKRAEKIRLKYEKEFFEKAPVVHQNKYDYSLVKYKSRKGRVKIICPTHGEFSQQVHHHLLGAGCQKCSTSKGELRVEKYLQEKNLNYMRQSPYKYKPRHVPLTFDFAVYLSNGVEAKIEYDGEYHFYSIPWFGGERRFKRVQETDKIKNDYCKENNIPLLRIPYWDFENIETLIENFIATMEKERC